MLAAALAAVVLAPTPCGTVVSHGTRYPVRVTAGTIDCSSAVAILGAYLDEGAPPEGWVCSRGHYAQTYAAHCAREPDADVVVEAGNPTTVSAPRRVRRGATLTAIASGLRAGRYRLTIVADAAPARGARCLADLGASRRTRGGWVTLTGRVPRRLRCYQGASIRLGTVPAHAGAYHLVVGVKVAPAGWDADRSFLRRALRVS
jgi:hypothetical protein